MKAKPKAASWWSRNKKLIVVASIVLLAVVLLSFLFYQSQRPNYRDLEKEFSKLQIPGDWTLVQSDDKKGLGGRSCIGVASDVSCPILQRIYTTSKTTDMSVPFNLLAPEGYTLQSKECFNPPDNTSCKYVYFNNTYSLSFYSYSSQKNLMISVVFEDEASTPK